jgi:hypothetical protein
VGESVAGVVVDFLGRRAEEGLELVGVVLSYGDRYLVGVGLVVGMVPVAYPVGGVQWRLDCSHVARRACRALCAAKAYILAPVL